MSVEQPDVFPQIHVNRTLRRYIEDIDIDMPAIVDALHDGGELTDDEIMDTRIHISSRIKQLDESVWRAGAYHGWQQRIALYHGMDLAEIQRQLHEKSNVDGIQSMADEAASRVLSETLVHELIHRTFHVHEMRRFGELALYRGPTNPKEEAECRQAEASAPSSLVRVKVRPLASAETTIPHGQTDSQDAKTAALAG